MKRLFPFIFGIFFFGSILAKTQAAELPIFYLTDLEGSWTRLQAFYEKSGAFDKDVNGQYHLKPHVRFVYGGDAHDRFLGDLRVVRDLVRLKEETPGLVTLIAGNREIVKMRIWLELFATHFPQAIRGYPADVIQSWTTGGAQDRAVDRLKFILEKTMGAPQAFQLRAKELDEMDLAHDDNSVVASYLFSFRPSGEFRKLLKYSQLAEIFGPNLFVHSSITKENIGLIPGQPVRERNVRIWKNRLNDWYQTQISEWEQAVDREKAWSGIGDRPANDLILYPLPAPGQKIKQDNVVTGRNIDDHNNLVLPDPEVIKILTEQGIHRLIGGHTPSGHAACIARTVDGSFESIVADNSYCKNENVVSVVRIKNLKLRVTGEFNPVPEKNIFIPISATTEIFKPSFIGQKFPDDQSLIIGMTPEGQFVSFRMQNYKNQYDIQTTDAVCKRLIAHTGSSE